MPEHIAAIRTHGPCAIHRRSFQPIRGITGVVDSMHIMQLSALLLRQAAANKRPHRKDSQSVMLECTYDGSFLQLGFQNQIGGER